MILADLGHRIASGDLPSGSVLTLAQLEQDYGASRTIIREAVRVLEAKGLVTARRRVGLTVTPESDWNSLDPSLIRWRLSSEDNERHVESLIEMWAALLPTSCRLAAVRGSEEQRAQLVQLMRSAGAGDLVAMGFSQRMEGILLEFYMALLSATGNEMITKLAPSICEAIAACRNDYVDPSFSDRMAYESNRQIAEAIWNKDKDTAEQRALDFSHQVLRNMEAQGH